MSALTFEQSRAYCVVRKGHVVSASFFWEAGPGKSLCHVRILSLPKTSLSWNEVWSKVQLSPDF